jgi:aspartyl-tRNA synthetase
VGAVGHRAGAEAARRGRPRGHRHRAVEVEAKTLRVLNECPPLPFEINEFGTELANEDLRLQYRYLDLRRRSLQKVLILRHRLCKVIRDFMDAHNFLEVETPLLGKSTPEGRPRLSGTQPGVQRGVLRPTAVAAVVQSNC